MKSQNLTDTFKQDANSLALTDKMVNCFQNTKLNKWAITEHRCPKCYAPITNLEEYEFAQNVKECFSCTHFRGGK